MPRKFNRRIAIYRDKLGRFRSRVQAKRYPTTTTKQFFTFWIAKQQFIKKSHVAGEEKIQALRDLYAHDRVYYRDVRNKDGSKRVDEMGHPVRRKRVIHVNLTKEGARRQIKFLKEDNKRTYDEISQRNYLRWYRVLLENKKTAKLVGKKSRSLVEEEIEIEEVRKRFRQARLGGSSD